jgi:hypothetical protein
MLTLRSRYILHSTRIELVVGFSKKLAASIFDVVQEDQDASFFEM